MLLATERLVVEALLNSRLSKLPVEAKKLVAVALTKTALVEKR